MGEMPATSGLPFQLATEVLGDRWSLRIVSAAMYGTCRFSDFQQQLGIARNILAARLQHLVSHQILRKRDAGARGVRFEYVLTARGRDLFITLTALRQWAEHWYPAASLNRQLCDRRLGLPVPRVEVRDAAHRPLRLHDVVDCVTPPRGETEAEP